MPYISCDNCRYFNVPVDQQPCKDCVRNHDLCGEWSHHVMVKGCRNCLHSEQPGLTCISCDGEDYSEWERKERNGKKAKDY